MFCPSCGAKNPTGARACGDCRRGLPAAPGARSSLPDVAATLPDVPAQPPPQPPRILKRPPPLAPPPPVLEALPKRRDSVGPDDPTLVRPRVQSPSPITLPQVDPFSSDSSDTRPLADLPPMDTATTERLPPAPRPVTLAAQPPSAPVPVQEHVRRAGSAVRSAVPLGASLGVAGAVSTTPASAARAPVERESRAPARTEPSPAPQRTPEAARAEASAADTPANGQPAALAAPAASAAAIVDPIAHEHVELEIVATARALAAAVIDTVFAAGLAAGAVYAALQAKGVRVGWQPVVDMLHADPRGGALALVALPVLVGFLYHFVTVLALAGTVGQRALGLRVWAAATGRRPGLVRVVVRAAATVFGVALFAAGPLWGLLLDPRRRGLGDLVARSVVARAPRGKR